MKTIPQDEEKFRQWLEAKDAPADFLKWAQGKTPREAWDQCQNGFWLEWWLEEAGYQWPDKARAEYELIKVAERDAYNLIESQARTEFEFIISAHMLEYIFIRSQFDQKHDPREGQAWANYKRIKDEAHVKYVRIQNEAWDNCERITADTIRILLNFPF